MAGIRKARCRAAVLLVFFLSLILWNTAKAAAARYGGTNMGINFWFEDTSEDYFDALLPKIAATGAHLKISVQHLVDTKAGYAVTPMDSADFPVIRMCIEKAQALGIKVDMLMIYMEDKAWWANPIKPSGGDSASFFKHHKAAAMNVAALCDTYNIPILGLVNECDSLTDSDKAVYWADEVKTIRAAYPRLKLTCAAATWNGEARKLLDYKRNGIDNICNYLDFIGINLYPTLTTLPVSEVTAADLQKGWYGREFPGASTYDCSTMELLTRTYEAYKKPLLVTETGCVPRERGLADPLNNQAATKKSPDNKHVQYLYLKTAHDVLGACDFIAGIYIWDACDTWTPFYWLDNAPLVSYIAAYYGAPAGLHNFIKMNAYAPGMFSDVKESDWYSGSIAKAYELRLMLGNGPATFNPKGAVTIGESVVLASRLHSIYHDSGALFAAGTPWYQPYVDYALAHGILDRDLGDYTRPATRAEFAAILARALPPEALEAVNPIGEGDIPDVSGRAPYADSVYVLYRAGILQGVDEKGTFLPRAGMERCLAAVAVTRMADQTLRKTSTL